MTDRVLKAHLQMADGGGLRIEPAHAQRQWMNEIPMPAAPGIPAQGKGFANRCLPLLMANQLGWNIVSEYSYVITNLPSGHFAFMWNDPKGMPPWGEPRNNFGTNIVTWPVPWLFETPPDYDLLIIPPPNTQLPTGVTCLTGLVETDHAVETFTLNWKVEEGLSLFIEAGQVIATIVPFPTALVEGFRLEFDTDTPPGHKEWAQRRDEANNIRNLDKFGKWQKDYWNKAKRLKLRKG